MTTSLDVPQKRNLIALITKTLAITSLDLKSDSTYHQHIEHHVIVVDKEYQLLLAVWELSRHFEDKILNLCLKLAEGTTHMFTGEGGVDADNGSRELGKPAGNLIKRKKKLGRRVSDKRGSG